MNRTMVSEHFEALYPENSRFPEIEKILDFIKGGNSIQLISLPGVGRSNLLGLLSYNTKVRLKHLRESQKNFHFVNLNLSEVRGKPTTEVFKFIFLELWESLRERKYEYEEVKKILKQSMEFSDEMVIFQGLKKTLEFLTLEKKLTVVLLFDRFETYVPTLTSEFFSSLRVLRNRAKYRFSCIFSLGRPLEETIENELLSDFYEFVVGHQVFLPLLDKPGLDFRISYLEKSKGEKIDKKILSMVFALTGGHGKLTRLCAEAYLAFSNQRLAFSSNQLEKFLLNQKPVQGALLEIYNALTPSEHKLIENGESNEFLEKVELIKNGKILIPIFEEFIKQYKPKEKFSLESFSDNLSSLEFKLLKFFYENPGRIIERDEIVQNVWEDSKSTAGVTDQALDQLIFRLRKKIEEDPNNPKYLQTIKGRGFRFTS